MARPTSGYQPMLPHRSPGLTSPSTFSGMPVRKVTASVNRRPAEPPSVVSPAVSAAASALVSSVSVISPDSHPCRV